MAPLDSTASTACWRSWRLFLVRNVMLLWVSWGHWTKLRPTPSSTVLVAHQVTSKLRHWWAKLARWAPTCNPSTSACCWSLGCSRGLWSVGYVGTVPASPAGSCMKGLRVLSDSSLVDGWLEDPKRSNTDILVSWVLPVVVSLLAWDDAESLVIFWKVTDDPVILSARRKLLTRCCSTFGSGPNTCNPSNGAVHTMLRTWGWNPKFWSIASLRTYWRLDAAANPDDMAATWASWMIASFSLSSFDLSSLGDDSEMTEVTMESAKHT